MNTTLLDRTSSLRQFPAWLRHFGYGYFYWLAFLLVLEPGNMLGRHDMGHTLDLGIEVARISIAALLGASVSPLLVALTRQFPVPGARVWLNVSIHAASAIGLAFVLIVVSCFLAAWMLLGQVLPTVAEIGSQLAANWSLLVFAISAFSAVLQAVCLFPRRADEAQPSSSSGQPARVAVKTRGLLSYVEVDNIDWVESQGNYLAKSSHSPTATRC
jgi:hypothetical protein